MSNKEYTHAVYIGRFQPAHLGHIETIKFGLSIADKVIVIVGSTNKPIDWENPWIYSERVHMLKGAFSEDEQKRIYFNGVEDRLYQDNEWAASVYESVDNILLDYSKYRVKGHDKEHTANICLIGYEKDDTSWYLHKFPMWHLQEAKMYTNHPKDKALSSTMIRTMIYNDQFGYAKAIVPESTYKYITEEWMDSDSYKYIKEWYKQDVDYAKPYQTLPYGTNFYCADSLVFQSGHLLLIKRKNHPGKDLWALPGGHVNLDETAEEASLRELIEETEIKVPEKVLKGSLKESKIFDHPNRSLRCRVGKISGRTISYSFCYVLDDSQGLPRIKAGDDAKEAWWFNINELRKMTSEIFEDHKDIIEYYINRI